MNTCDKTPERQIITGVESVDGVPLLPNASFSICVRYGYVWECIHAACGPVCACLGL